MSETQLEAPARQSSKANGVPKRVRERGEDDDTRDASFSALTIGAALALEEARIEGGVERVPTGWPKLDAALGGGLIVPSLNVLGAAPKSGKSTWAQIVATRHVEAGGVAYVLDLENGRRRFLRQMLSRHAQLGPQQVAQALADDRAGAFESRGEVERWAAAKAWLRSTLAAGLFVEFTPPGDFSARIAGARRAAGDRKLLVVVDSLQKLPGDPRDDRRTAVDKWIKLFERLRYEYETTLLVISEIRRGKEGYAAREDAFKESGGIEYAADLAMTLDRAAADEDEGEQPVATLRVELARDCDEDPRGDVASYTPVRPFYGLQELEPVPRVARRRGRKPVKMAGARDFLKELLANGPVQVAEALRAGKAEGYSEPTLQRAKRAIGVNPCTLGGQSAWRLP